MLTSQIRVEVWARDRDRGQGRSEAVYTCARVGMNLHSNGIEQELAHTCKDDAQHLDVHLHTSWEQLSPRSRSPLETAISAGRPAEETEDDETRPLISKKIEEKRKGIKII